MTTEIYGSTDLGVSRETVSSEGRTAPTDTALVARNPFLTTNGAVPSMPVSKRTRYEVLRRDNHTCRYCGGTAPDVVLTVDHVTPVALGGSDKPDNLVAACKDCNAGKASTSPDEVMVTDVQQADFRWSQAIARAAEIRATERDLEIVYVNAFEDIWRRWCPDNFGDTILAFRKAGLPQEEMVDAAMIALTNRAIEDRWRYFCGVAWRKVGALQEMAKSILEAEEAGA